MRSRTRHLQLVAVCDSDKERLESVAREFDLTAYSDYEQMLADPEVHIVAVNTPVLATNVIRRPSGTNVGSLSIMVLFGDHNASGPEPRSSLPCRQLHQQLMELPELIKIPSP